VTRIVNIPINNQLERWSETALPSTMRETWGHWEKFHTVRTILFVAAFTLETVAMVVFG
jgi:hypothetical protein